MNCDFRMQKQGNAVLGAAPRWSILLCLWFLLSIMACAREFPTLEPADLPISLVLQRLEQQRSDLFAYRAVATLRVRGGKQPYSGKAFLVSLLPRSLRLEVVGFLGQPLLYAVSDGKTFVVWQPGSENAYQGLTSGNTLTSLLGIPFEDSEALLLLVGIVPPVSYREARLFRQAETQSLMLMLEDDVSRLIHRIWLDAGAESVTKIVRLQAHKPLLEARYADYDDTQGFLYPKSVELEGAEVSLSLHYQQFTINEPLGDETFRLALPVGVEILPW